jgi:hypothetical protein
MGNPTRDIKTFSPASGSGDGAMISWAMHITLNLPQDVAEGLAVKWADLPRAALESLALEGYRAGALTQAQVRRLLGFRSLAEIDGFLKQHYLEYTLDDLEQDTANSPLVTR